MHTISVNQEVDALLKGHIESRANERAERSREQPVIARSGGPSETEESDHKESAAQNEWREARLRNSLVCDWIPWLSRSGLDSRD